MQRLLPRSSETPYYHPYFNPKTYSTFEIVTNQRDAMVFAEISTLSPDISEEELKNDLISFRDLVIQQYGGKTITRLSPNLLDVFPAERRAAVADIIYSIITPGAGLLRYLSMMTAEKAYDNNKQKDFIKAHIDRFETGEYRLVPHDELVERVAELSEFKNLSGIVNEAKVLNGQYSDIAELNKLNNPNNRHVAIVDKNNKFIGYGMWTIQGDMAYGADYIIAPAYQSANLPNHHSGFSKALGCKMFEDIKDTHPEVDKITFIGGVSGNLQNIQDSLYGSEGFNCISIEKNKEKQIAHGVIVNFQGPGPIMMKLMNRDSSKNKPGDCSTLDEDEYVEKALQQVKRATLSHLAAPQPLPQTVDKVVGISSFEESKNEKELPQNNSNNEAGYRPNPTIKLCH